MRPFRFLLLLILMTTTLAVTGAPMPSNQQPSGKHRTVQIEGWQVHINQQLAEQEASTTERAIQLLTVQLSEINQVVPSRALDELHKVPLWINPEYANIEPRAEYHPGAGWLRDNQRDAAMAKAVEFTNVRIFEQETRRMPNFALHELAHAYHDRVLEDGFENAEVQSAFEHAKKEGLYENVEQRFGDGRSAKVRAYALTNSAEYFAEVTEAFFSTNDFFPFNRNQLEQYDPRGYKLMQLVWGLALEPSPSESSTQPNPTTANTNYDDWQFTGAMFVLTTPEGADLPPTAKLENFPLLVRLHKGWFNFQQAKPRGEDLRFSTPHGQSLPYQIEAWDSEQGTASIWVLVPEILGNARQEIRLHWGNPHAESESQGTAVFNESNGYASVMHLGEVLADDVGAIQLENVRTSATPGIIGDARRLEPGQGIFAGDQITSLPAGVGPMTTEAWFRAREVNGNVLAWGKEQRPGKVMMQFESPPSVAIRCYFADVEAATPLQLDRWYHVVHTYTEKDSRVYVNGQLDGKSDPVLDIPTTTGLWIGGWYGSYNFSGDVDEVRISKVARSAEWIKLQYENQKPLQSVVGHLVQPGNEWSVSTKSLELAENQTVTLSAIAGGAQKVRWIGKRGEINSQDNSAIMAVDQFHYEFQAGRVAQDTSTTVQFQAIYADEVKTWDIPVSIRNAIPEPIVSISAPSEWDGRSSIEVVPNIDNRETLLAANASQLNYRWQISGIAAIHEIRDGRLSLMRAQNSGKLTVTVWVDNGGPETIATTTIDVREPAEDPWIERTATDDEKPMNNQFFPRDNRNEGTLFCNGTVPEPTDTVELKLFADEQLLQTYQQVPTGDGRYRFAIKLKPGLIRYRMELVAIRGKQSTELHRASNLVCGDAFLIMGQSNALATDWGPEAYEYSSDWIRSFGSNQGDISRGWDNAVRREGGHFEIGCWGMDLARSLVESHQIPICIINGAVGGTLIEAHQRNPANHEDPDSIYGRMLRRVKKAGLTHGIRGVFWYQGENNQGAQGKTGRYGWETYESFFVSMAGAWQQDFPNIQHLYVFQIWPNACAMGGRPASDRLRDIQRRLPRLYSKMTAIATLGIKPEGGCHFPPTGYAALARQLLPVVEQFNYNQKPTEPVTSPNLRRAAYTNHRRDEIELEFDQAMSWSDSLISQFYFESPDSEIRSGKVSGNRILLQLEESSTATKISYLRDKSWDSNNLLSGANGLAALTFFQETIQPANNEPE